MSGSLSPGSQIGRFIVEAEAGWGGMGVVYRCTDPELDQPVALKVLAQHLVSDSSALARFHREASLFADLQHPHIAHFHELGEYNGRPFIVLDWIEGQTLKTLLAAEGTLPLERSLALFKQVAEALDYAQSQGIVHRDLKPANLIIGPDDQVTIVDFGLAWFDTAPSITSTGMILGTPLYLSPELIKGDPIDGRSDQYSLAVILYEMLCGQSPFEAMSVPALYQQQLYIQPAPISEKNPSLPMSVENALEKALSKEPDGRFATLADFYAALLAPAEAPQPHIQAAPRWRYTPESTPATRPVLVEELLIVATELGVLAALDPATGVRVWEIRLGAGIPAPPAVFDDREETLLIVATSDGDLYGLGAAGARFCWRVGGANLTGAIAGGVTAGDDGFLYAATRDGFIYQVEPRTGKLRWELVPDQGVGFSHPPAVSGGILYMAGDNGTLAAVDPAARATRWSSKTYGRPSLPPYPVPTWGSLLCATEAGGLHDFHPADGKLVWETRVDGGVTGLAHDDRQLYAITSSGTLYAWETASGQQTWKRSLDGRPCHGPVIIDRMVLAATRPGQLRYYDPATGQENREYRLQLDEPITTTPAGKGAWLFVTGEKSIYGLGPMSGTAARGVEDA